MKANIQRIRDYLARIRRNPESSSSMTPLALSEIVSCLEDIDERLAKLEALASSPIVCSPPAISAEELQTLMAAPMALLMPARDGDAAGRAEWAIGAKV